MKNISLKSIILSSSLLIGSGCIDTNIGDRLILDETTICGPVNIRLYQEVQRMQSDDYILEIHDKDGKLRVNFRSQNLLSNGTMILHDDGKKYTVKDGKRYYELSKEKKNLESTREKKNSSPN